MNNQDHGSAGLMTLTNSGQNVLEPHDSHNLLPSGDSIYNTYNASPVMANPQDNGLLDNHVVTSPSASNHHSVPSNVLSSPQPSTSSALTEPVAATSADGSAPAYDDMFPALPDGPSPGPVNNSPVSAIGGGYGASAKNSSTIGRGPASAGNGGHNNNKMAKYRPSVVTQVYRVAPENRRSLMDVKNRMGSNNNVEGSSSMTSPEQAKICRDIMAKTSTTIELCIAKDGTLTFMITGKEDAVAAAKRAIGSELQTQATSSVSIPKAHHRFILGKNGKKLNELQEATGTKITVPRQEADSDSIKIVGTKEGIDKAVHELLLVSHEIASKDHAKLDIERMYHPFINGPFGETAKAIADQTGAKINIPPPSANKDEISISGETAAVAQAKEIVTKLVDEKRRKCKTVQVEVKKQQHRYVIGPRGQTLQEILKKTGVSIEMPPSDNPSETITLRGEQEKLGPALTLLYEKAHSEVDDEIDAPSWLQRYIIGPKGSHLQEVSANFSPNVTVNFIAAENKIKLHGPPKDVEKAKEVLEGEVKRVTRDVAVGEMKVDPKYHRFLIGKSGATINMIRQKTGASITIPAGEVDGSGSHVIRIEGNPAEVEGAKAELDAIIKKRMETDANISREVVIDQRFHRNVIGTKGEKIREIRELFNQVVITFPESNTKSDKVTIRGPKEDVDNCYKHLAQLNKDLQAMNYRTEVPIFKQFHKFVIGKDGSNIKKIRDETNTKIELPAEGSESDVIVISGKKVDVDKAVEKIKQFQDELTSVQQVDIIIPSKFHNAIIGAKGRQIRSIMEECGGVLIKFPSEGSGSDKVSIRGPKDSVAKAKQVLVELSNEKQVNSFSVEVKARPELHRFLIGKNGINIKKVRDSTGARIFFPSEKERDSTDDGSTIVIMGRKEDVLKAKAELETMIVDLEKVVEDSVKVDPKHHKHFVSRRGHILKQISEEFGGVLISFPRQGSKDTPDKVTLKGSKECVERAKQKILDEVKRLDSLVTIEVVIDAVHHRSLMGARGSNVQAVQNKYNVAIKFPDRRTDLRSAEAKDGSVEDVTTNGGHEEDDSSSVVSEGPNSRRDVIKVTGSPADVEAAKQALLESVPVEVQVEVPFDYHRFIIGQKGREVRDLMERFDVSISVPHSSTKSDIIRVTGTASNAARAKAMLLEKVEKLDQEKSDREAKSFRVELHVDPMHHPKIIGKRGAIISKIRIKHDVQIQFPERNNANSNNNANGGANGASSPVTSTASDLDLIVITGYQANAEAARDEILALVKSLESQSVRELKVDARIHPRLIGTRGKTINTIMKKFNVDIKFPRNGDPDPNLVTISGEEDDVDAAADHILNLEEEYLDDTALEFAPPRGQSDGKRGQSGPGGKGFVVAGAPWQMPDTNDTEQFPSMAGGPSNGDAVDAASTDNSPWKK